MEHHKEVGLNNYAMKNSSLEEVIEIIGEIFVIGAKPCSPREIVDACASAYTMLKEQPSLPSNLDEAAIQAAQIDMCDRQIMEDSNERRMLYSRIFRRGFKAGAEWMAGQSYADEVKYSDLEDRKYVFVPYEEFNPGDKVIVQIRKKQ